MLGLIDSHPAFEEHVDSFPEAQYVDKKDIDRKAREMFLAYVEKYNVQIERVHYYKNEIDNLLVEFSSMGSEILLVPGYVNLNAVLEFKSKTIHKSSLKPIQAYLGFLGIRALKKLRSELYRELEDIDLTFTRKLTLYGENGYSADDLPEFVYGVMHDLPLADGFKIESTYYGPSIAPWFEANSKERRKEFFDEVTEIGRSEKFTYMIFEFLHNHGVGYFSRTA